MPAFAYTEWPGAGPFPASRFQAGAARIGVGEGGASLQLGGAELGVPPDGWEVGTGTWGYDFGQENKPARIRTGSRTILSPSTARAGTRMQQTVNAQMPVEAGRIYKGWIVAMTDSTAAGAVVVSNILWYTQAGVLFTASNILGSALTAANAWQRTEVTATAPVGAFFARINFGPSNATFDGTTQSGFNMWVDEAGFMFQLNAPNVEDRAVGYVHFSEEGPALQSGAIYNANLQKFTRG